LVQRVLFEHQSVEGVSRSLGVSPRTAWKREELVRLRAVTTLFSEDRMVGNSSSMDRLFLTRTMSGGDAPSPLPRGEAALLPPETDDWVRNRSITAYVVLKDGAVVVLNEDSVDF